MALFISFLSGIALFYLFLYFPFSTIVATLLSFLYLSIKRKFLLALIVLLGVAFAFVRYEPVKDIWGKEVFVRGIFESYPVETQKGLLKQILNIEFARDLKTGKELSELAGKSIVLLSDRRFDVGRKCEVVIEFLKGRNRLNPGSPRTDELYAKLLHVFDLEDKRVSINSKIQEYRYRLSSYISENLKRDSGALVASITIGHRANIDEDLRDAFNATGLAHILSISGTHFGLFSVFLFGIFRSLIGALPYRVLERITVFLTPSQAAAILCLPFMIAYLGLSGGSVPAVRSFIMISLFLTGLVIGRKGFWLNSLVFAAFVLTVWDPDVILSLSFQLSFLAVLFIGFALGDRNKASERGETLSSQCVSKIFRYIKNALLITISASIGVAPLVAYHFHYLSVISPLANLLVAPLIGFALIPLSVASSFLFLITGHYVFTPFVSAISDVSILAVKLLATVPFADVKIPAFPPIIVLLFYAGFILYFLLGRKKYALVIPFVPIVIYLFLHIFEKKELTVTYLDVGQGDSAVVELPDGKTIVIDTGKTGRETAMFLKYRGKETINAIALSHVHPDHVGGLDYLLDRFKVDEIWKSGRLILPDTIIADVTHRVLSRGDIVEGKGYSIYVLHPYPEFYTMHGNEHTAANNDSLVMKINGKDKAFLFTGDIEEEAKDDILHLSKWLKSDVIKVPHHGSKKSTCKMFLDAVSPEIAVISVGRNNPFGHPHKDTLDVLQGVKTFRTDIDGAIKIRESEKGLEVKTYKDFQFKMARSFSDEKRNIKRLFTVW